MRQVYSNKILYIGKNSKIKRKIICDAILTNKKKIELIEDSAETLGATWKKSYTGSFGTGCFSFFPTKYITR